MTENEETNPENQTTIRIFFCSIILIEYIPFDKILQPKVRQT